VLFEKENIWTFGGKGSFSLPSCRALHRKKSRSISENCTWGQRKRFQDGKVTVPFGRFPRLRPRRGRQPVLNEDEDRSYRRFTDCSYRDAHRMRLRRADFEGILRRGKKKTGRHLRSRASSRTRSTKATPFCKRSTPKISLPRRKSRTTDSSAIQCENNHPAISSREYSTEFRSSWRSDIPVRTATAASAFFKQNQVRQCGSWYGSKVWHSNDKYRKVIWQCHHNSTGIANAEPHISPRMRYGAFHKSNEHPHHRKGCADRGF
jgi:hypothetical protein